MKKRFEQYVEVHITKEEEALMGIDEDVTETFRAEHDILGSDDLQGYVPGAGPSKRSRAESAVAIEPVRKVARS